MSRVCEVCEKNEVGLQYDRSVGNWFPSQCLECEKKGLRGECGLTHDPSCLENAFTDNEDSSND